MLLLTFVTLDLMEPAAAHALVGFGELNFNSRLCGTSLMRVTSR